MNNIYTTFYCIHYTYIYIYTKNVYNHFMKHIIIKSMFNFMEFQMDMCIIYNIIINYYIYYVYYKQNI